MAGPETKRIESLALLTGLDEKVLRHGTILEGTAAQPELGLVNKVSNLRREHNDLRQDVQKLEAKHETASAIPAVSFSPDRSYEALEARVKKLEEWKAEAEPLLEELKVVRARMRTFVTVAAGGSGGIVALLQALIGG